jgi:hypothetical protein
MIPNGNDFTDVNVQNTREFDSRQLSSSVVTALSSEKKP